MQRGLVLELPPAAALQTWPGPTFPLDVRSGPHAPPDVRCGAAPLTMPLAGPRSSNNPPPPIPCRRGDPAQGSESDRERAREAGRLPHAGAGSEPCLLAGEGGLGCGGSGSHPDRGRPRRLGRPGCAAGGGRAGQPVPGGRQLHAAPRPHRGQHAAEEGRRRGGQGKGGAGLLRQGLPGEGEGGFGGVGCPAAAALGWAGGMCGLPAFPACESQGRREGGRGEGGESRCPAGMGCCKPSAPWPRTLHTRRPSSGMWTGAWSSA